MYVHDKVIPFMYWWARTRIHVFPVSCGPTWFLSTCVGSSIGCIKSYNGNPDTIQRCTSVRLVTSACFFHSGAHARPYSVGTYTDAPTAIVLTAYNQPSNRASPCLVQGTMIYLCGLLLKWIPVTRVFLINMLNWLSVQVNLTPPISLANMLHWLSVALINLTLPFLT